MVVLVLVIVNDGFGQLLLQCGLTLQPSATIANPVLVSALCIWRKSADDDDDGSFWPRSTSTDGDNDWDRNEGDR